MEEIKQGYIFRDKIEEYVCLVCGQSFVKGIIYPDNGLLYEAEKGIQMHIQKEHVSMFEYLIALNRRYTGLTDHQQNLLRLFYSGVSDKEIATKLDVGSTSTIRNHRFTFREKQKQAKVFLAIMELLEEGGSKDQGFICIPRSATMIDERFAITEEENARILKSYFPEGLNGPLSQIPAKEKRKIVVLRHILQRFVPGRDYTEKEVNGVLKAIYQDYVTLRRYLIEYGFMDRDRDGSRYWVKL